MASSRTDRGRARTAWERTTSQLAHAVRGWRHPEQDYPARTPWIRAVSLGTGTGIAAGAAAAAGASALAGHFARSVVTPVRERPEDLEILAVIKTGAGEEVVLPANSETIIEGTYGLTFNAGTAMARVGEITALEPRDGTVTRRVEAVYGGELRNAVRGWWSSTIYPDPGAAGHPAYDVVVELPGGPAPAWHVPPRDESGPLAGQGIWGIAVHGRGGRRTEGLKALDAASDLGIDMLLMSYRNDGEAPDAEDGRYGLGVTEWEDIEAGARYALDHGAQELVLFGWSMGGAIALQMADRSPLAACVRALVLTGPVVDWIDVLAYQARANRIPHAVGRLGQWFIANEAGRRTTGLAAPVDLKALNWIDRADQLHVRTLIMHSSDDPVVPYGPSRDLAARNEMVTFVPFAQARHVKEWNYDPQRWNAHVTEWLEDLFTAEAPPRIGEVSEYVPGRGV
ncbi:MAG TPA: lysophospholipase [Candidatus Nesterenkonia stercoripullorum]|uniref:Lysophospholipase n=1 Tax=Candidatus Nesterenkonia stercoripullorum TaxID=2838701 RepID=A0A9D1S2Z2_9MICC|nr:lysophospholipase [Candidatus Nesterenkonia stercoripullorum]